MHRKFILISLPDDFAEKFINFVHNVNMVNTEIDPPIFIEEVFDQNPMEVDGDDGPNQT